MAPQLLATLFNSKEEAIKNICKRSIINNLFMPGYAQIM